MLKNDGHETKERDEDERAPPIPEENWIAVMPPRNSALEPPKLAEQSERTGSGNPPSFSQSQFDVILRRQRVRPSNGFALKQTNVPSRFLNLSNDIEFSGWGSFVRIQLSEEDYEAGQKTVRAREDEKVLGQFTASALAGNAVLGSVFYALPAVVGVASIYSPISLFIATLTLFLWRPIMEELGSAFPLQGAPYSYVLNVSSKPLALLSASLLLLDFASTSVVSAATAASYLAGELATTNSGSLPLPEWTVTVIILVLFMLVSLTGIKESAKVALCVLSFHILTMTALIIISSIHLAHIRTSQMAANWSLGARSDSSSTGVARQVFRGFCLGMLGLTGFECTPAYLSRIKPGRLPLVLRNLHYPAVILNCTLMTLVLGIIPLEEILGGTNVLSVLGDRAGGRWLRIWITVDAIVVLCGGVLTGILSSTELISQLSLDHVLPTGFRKLLPVTKAPWVSITSFCAFSAVVYLSAAPVGGNGGNEGKALAVVSQMFSLTWLTVMSLFPLSLLLLRYNRHRLPRSPHTRLSVVFVCLAVCAVVAAGNVWIEPKIGGYFAAYLLVILLLFSASQNKTHLLRFAYWTFDQYPVLHRLRWTRGWGEKLIGMMRRVRKRPVGVLVKSDEINHLFQMILYVRNNEETSCVKLIHFVDGEAGIPSELEANAKILDEAFPEITIDLVIVVGSQVGSGGAPAFSPTNIAALSNRLGIPTCLMFMSCPGPRFEWGVAELGTRIVSL
ncbi:hypothetical protein K435DRAFT_973734 [Dendrothele bispora CBS 962.96]|uniref:AAAP amino acid permease n=1 Tax=Dendrothele bispora (strain CBS 962.96) TaxID=1314807 RepID=A0A4S8KRE9_DENBC|nr:hypothetical protein K435DRAFT_973734 [Dendrothele bispora CBS 962.96]